MLRPLIATLVLISSAQSVFAGAMQQQVLAVHNQERAAVGVAPLSWNDDLAIEAATWAQHLADTNSFQHADRSQNPNHGENLWMGTRGAYSYSDMAQGWADEKSYFQYGTFPDVSNDGNWANVGHYTQMIWANTTEVGCAVASNASSDFMVCRYSPSGNYMGQKVY